MKDKETIRLMELIRGEMSRALPVEQDPSAVKHLLSMSRRQADRASQSWAQTVSATVKHPKHQETNATSLRLAPIPQISDNMRAAQSLC